MSDSKCLRSAIKKATLFKTWVRFALPALVWVFSEGLHAGPESGVADAMDRPALQAKRQSQFSAIITLARVGTRIVAAGERGEILLSDDNGNSWRQATEVPASVTLTAINFPSEMHGWAVGHSGVILHTRDGGERWEKQLDGIVGAQLILKAAQIASQAGGDQSLQSRANQILQDGPDKPLLCVKFENSTNGIAVGAYGIAFRTTDGGKAWVPWMSVIDNPQGLHLNDISMGVSGIWIVGERGLVLRGASLQGPFKKVPTPYAGSYFAVSENSFGDVVVAGLKGNVFLTKDGGRNWKKVSTPSQSSVTSIRKSDSGRLVMTTQTGNLWMMESKGVIRELGVSLPAMPTSIAEGEGGKLIVSTLRGIAQVNPGKQP